MKTKSSFVTIILILGCLLLASCMPPPNTSRMPDLTQEHWLHQMNIHPRDWMRDADDWFLASDLTRTEEINAPHVTIRVPDFNNIRINGNFAVQLYGTNGPDISSYGNSSQKSVVIPSRGDIYANTKDVCSNFPSYGVLNKRICRRILRNEAEFQA